MNIPSALKVRENMPQIAKILENRGITEFLDTRRVFTETINGEKIPVRISKSQTPEGTVIYDVAARGQDVLTLTDSLAAYGVPHSPGSKEYKEAVAIAKEISIDGLKETIKKLDFYV